MGKETRAHHSGIAREQVDLTRTRGASAPLDALAPRTRSSMRSATRKSQYTNEKSPSQKRGADGLRN